METGSLFNSIGRTEKFEKPLDKIVATKYHKECSNIEREVNKMAAMKKGTKLTDNPKDYMLRVRMDKETVSKLDTVCEIQGLSRSEVVRNGIEEQYQRLKK